jgi:hypothetical protein
VIGHVLVGWCTVHAVIYLALLIGLMRAALFAHHVWSDRRSEPGPVQPPPVPFAPSWAHDTPFVPAGSGRHRKTTGSTR